MSWLNGAVLKSDRDLVCTACYGTLARRPDGWLLRTTAGHPLPIHVSTLHGSRAIGGPGTLLGAFATIRTSTTETLLRPGDKVVFHTDGVTDLAPPHGLDPDEMVQLVDSLRARDSAGDMVDAIRASVLQRVPEPNLRDDIALVVLRVEPD